MRGKRKRFGPLDHLVEVLARQEFLDDVGDPVLDAEIVDRRDVAVMKVAGQLRLPEEAALHLLVVQLAGLDRDGALDERIAALEDSAKAADADLLGNLVFADLVCHVSPKVAMSILIQEGRFRRAKVRKLRLVATQETGCRCSRWPVLPRLPAARRRRRRLRPGPRPRRIVLVRKFSPPADGLLTDTQIDRYIARAPGRARANRRRRRAGRSASTPTSSPGCGRGCSRPPSRSTRSGSAPPPPRPTRARSPQLHETRAAVRDAATLRTIDEQIAALEKERAAWKKPEPPPPAIAANARAGREAAGRNRRRGPVTLSEFLRAEIEAGQFPGGSALVGTAGPRPGVGVRRPRGRRAGGGSAGARDALRSGEPDEASGNRALSTPCPVSIRTILPEGFFRPGRRRATTALTLEKLLTHTSGLPAWYPLYARGEGAAAYRRTLASIELEARAGDRP